MAILDFLARLLRLRRDPRNPAETCRPLLGDVYDVPCKAKFDLPPAGEPEYMIDWGAGDDLTGTIEAGPVVFVDLPECARAADFHGFAPLRFRGEPEIPGEALERIARAHTERTQDRAKFWADQISRCTNEADADRMRDLCRQEVGLPPLSSRYFVVHDDDVTEPSSVNWPPGLQDITFTVRADIPGAAQHFIDCTTMDGAHRVLSAYPPEATAQPSDSDPARDPITTEGNTMNTPATGGKKASKPPVMRDYYARDKITGKERIISAPSLGDANRFATRDMIEVRLLSTADAMRLAGQGVAPEVAADPTQEALPLAAEGQADGDANSNGDA